MLSKNRSFFYLIQDIAGEESSECATRKRKAQSVSAITCWRKLSIEAGNIETRYNLVGQPIHPIAFLIVSFVYPGASPGHDSWAMASVPQVLPMKLSRNEKYVAKIENVCP